MGKLIKTNHWQQKTRGFNDELDKKTMELLSYATLSHYNKDMGFYGMTTSGHKPMSEALNKKPD